MSRITLPRIKKIVSGFGKRSVLVVGDLMLDRFIRGKVSRISPEAPIPVVEEESVTTIPGGAANVICNILALGGKSHVCGVIGIDPEGEELKALLKKEGSNVSAVISSSSVRTIVKIRVIAHHQHLVRIDREHSVGRDGRMRKKLLESIRRKAAGVDAVIIEDYGKGVVDDELVHEVIKLSESRKIIVAVDPKIEHDLDFSGADVVTPNTSEAYYFAEKSQKKGDSIEDVGKELLRKWRKTSVLVTLGDKGMCLFEHGKKPRYIKTVAKEVFDVAGAGDTVIAALTMAMASGADLFEAAVIANLAAGIVVQKSGVETASRREIIESAKTEL